jgi:hypothetical protein
MPFDQRGDVIAPAELFHIRSRFPTPDRKPLCVYQRLEPNRPYAIFGAACAGDIDVTGIWISLDGGASWFRAISWTR